MTAATVFGVEAWLLACAVVTFIAVTTYVLVVEPIIEARRQPGDVALDEYERVEAGE